MQIWAESGKSALPICNYSQILYQFLTFTQNLKRSLFYGIYPVEGIGVFRVPKNGDARNKKPPALRVETKRCTKKSPFRYNRVVQALL